MEIRYFKEYSHHLNRDMEFKIYGNGGKLCFAFPPQNGKHADFESFGMVDTVARWIEAGKITLVCPDAIDEEPWSAKDGDPAYRAIQQENYYNYIAEELYPRVKELTGCEGKALTTGCSMGAAHAAIFFFRRPDLFDAIVALSGVYDANLFFPGYMDGTLYFNSPVHFLANMPTDHEHMNLYKQSDIIICVGQGAWEDEMIESTKALESVMNAKEIPAWVDYWGHDVNHDWNWWQVQLPYFFEKLFN